MQRPGAAGPRRSSGKVFGLCASRVDGAGSGSPLCSSPDHLLLEPLHLQKGNTRGTCTDVHCLGSDCLSN